MDSAAARGTFERRIPRHLRGKPTQPVEVPLQKFGKCEGGPRFTRRFRNEEAASYVRSRPQVRSAFYNPFPYAPSPS